MMKATKTMQEHTSINDEELVPGRRRVLEMMAMATVALPILGLQACGGDGESVVESTARDGVEPALKSAVEQTETAASSMADSAKTVAEDVSESLQSTVREARADAQEAADDANTIATDAMVQLDENGAQAMGLGYRHDATEVENARYKPGQQCSNCVLFQGGSSAWGGCGLFIGKQVKATGWCSAYSVAA